jgi:hypothetical protein
MVLRIVRVQPEQQQQPARRMMIQLGRALMTTQPTHRGALLKIQLRLPVPPSTTTSRRGNHTRSLTADTLRALHP